MPRPRPCSRRTSAISSANRSRRRAAKTPAKDAAEAILYRALEKGLSFKTTMGNVITLTPPLTVTDAEMTWALDILDACFAEIA